MTLELFIGYRPEESPQRFPSWSAAATVLLQSGAVMGYVQESWSEAQVIALPEGEHNFFERKSGSLLSDRGNFNTKIAKALSAFANSGGGHLILGQQDNGVLDGVPEQEGRTPIREWLEQKIPTLVAYPLESFRVHLVELDTPSQVPKGKSLIVIDIGDSRLAPHQAAIPSDAPQYYYRQGGKSVAAPHHYLEALRNRLTFAVVEPQLKNIQIVNSIADEGEKYVVETVLVFEVKNVSRVACYKWTVSLSLNCEDGEEDILSQGVVDIERFPKLGRGRMQVPSDQTILPTQRRNKDFLLGLRIDPAQSVRDQVAWFLDLEANYSVISETYLGTERQTKFSDIADLDTLTAEVNRSLGTHKSI